MSDPTTTLNDLRHVVKTFVDERDWNQFHSPKNLSMAMAIEVSELMEHFQWLTIEESKEVSKDPEAKHHVEEELADVLCYVLALANSMNIDLSDSLTKKMVKNREKYPAEDYRGRF